MKVRDFDEFFKSIKPGFEVREPCDGLKAGSLDRDASKVAVTWMATLGVVRAAADWGANLIITHEPTFYSHSDREERLLSTPPALAKKDALERLGIAVYRAHEAWDWYPVYGIRDAWLEELGLTFVSGAPGGAAIAKLPRRTTFAGLVRLLRKKMGLRAVRTFGDPKRPVKTVALGQGSSGCLPALAAIDARADAVVVGEASEWQTLTLAREANLPIAFVGHAASETAGMRKMALFLAEKLPGCEYKFFDARDEEGQGC